MLKHNLEGDSHKCIFYTPLPESILACLLAAHSSIFNFGIPSATAFAIPPSCSTFDSKKKPKNYISQLNKPFPPNGVAGDPMIKHDIKW